MAEQQSAETQAGDLILNRSDDELDLGDGLFAGLVEWDTSIYGENSPVQQTTQYSANDTADNTNPPDSPDDVKANLKRLNKYDIEDETQRLEDSADVALMVDNWAAQDWYENPEFSIQKPMPSTEPYYLDGDKQFVISEPESVKGESEPNFQAKSIEPQKKRIQITDTEFRYEGNEYFDVPYTKQEYEGMKRDEES